MFLIVLIDQIIKFYIKLNFKYQEEVIIFDWFRLLFVENKGMAYGMHFGGYIGKLILSILRIGIVGLIIYYVYKNHKKFTFLQLTPILLIMAGALGNILDGIYYGIIFSDSTYFNIAQLVWSNGYAPIFQGKVVDMFYFPLIKGTFPNFIPFWGGEDFVFFRPIFNFADSTITVGIFSLIIFYKKIFQNENK